MDKAKSAIKDFTAKAGHHDTTVHEHVAPAVVNEQILPTRHEEAQTVVDREVHQDHHHTTIQPVKDKEILPEQHSVNIVGTETKEYSHGDAAQIEERLARERAQFKNTTETASTRHSQSVAETVGGEHVHHHVHENIQPIVQKETIQPSVVHTVVPVHEVHHNEPKHHSASALPAVSLADFKAQGGTLQGREDRVDRFEGEPRTETSGQHSHHGGTQQHGLGQGADVTGSNQQTGSSRLESKLDSRFDSNREGSRTVGGTNTNTSTGTSSGYGNNQSGSGIGSQSSTSGAGRDDYSGSGNSGYDDPQTQKKPSLLDKLNPMKDSNNDGQAGFMK